MRRQIQMFVVVLALLFAAGCASGGGGTPPVVQPVPPVVTPPVEPGQPTPALVTFPVFVHDVRTPGTGLASVAVTCGTDTRQTNPDGTAHFDTPNGVQLDCLFVRTGYEPRGASGLPGIDSLLDVGMDRATPGPLPPGQALQPLHVEANGHWLATADGTRFDFREVTAFSLQSRMLRGEAESHVRPLLRQLRVMGFTLTRVLLTLDGDYWHAHSPIGYSLRSAPDMAGFWEHLDALVAMHAQEGLYTRLTLFGALEPFGGVWDPIARRDVFHGDVQRLGEAFALEVARRYADAPNVLLELSNEPVGIGLRDSSQKLADLGCRVKALAPNRLLNAGDINGMDEAAFFNRCFDMVDRHVDRTPDLDFMAAMKRMGEDGYRDSQPRTMPAISGEPVNFGESRVDGRTGDVASLPSAAYAYGAVTRARQILPNFHWDGGLYTTSPKPETIAAMEAFHRALNAFPMVDGPRWRGHWSPEQGNTYWSRDPYPGSDDPRDVADHVGRGRGPWRIFGVGDYSVSFPEPESWDWRRHLTSPAERIDHFTDGTWSVGIYRRVN